ncbi:SDR family NAD(P)-dependent oxidoreductase [Phycicoccus flavus]|uniref:SDR family NAD(P)-dependent oxidoreductase n=1 Tax=Phycicoccus flavus TaxID=2502783 RepID=UPI000FEB9C3E|nr:SDR family NAD(P)-dependent oxidoreductase [Phycicoccus flavus]NHA68262.1 SDR family oxidoreductase [Phycicoccus flavus]
MSAYQTDVGPRTAVVTGVGSRRGIGYATAKRFAEEGWAVAGLDLDTDAVTAAMDQIGTDHGVPTLAHRVDVTDESSVREAMGSLRQSDLPPLGALANIAGVPSPVPFLEVSAELWHRVLDINLTGTFLMCREALPAMIDGGYGRIVNMSSVSAQMGGGVFSKTPYSAAKAGVLGLTRSLAREMAEHGITVNAVSPGIVDTDIRAGATNEEDEARLSATVPLRRQATAGDIAALVVFLSSADAAYITGGTHNINGGSYIA